MQAHVLLCMSAHYVEWHKREVLAPILFDDDPADAKRLRRSVVAPVCRSARARFKAMHKVTPESLPVHILHADKVGTRWIGLS